MRAFVAFTKKEFCEITRTYKLFIMITVFFLIGMMNPITAKITPVLIKEYMPMGMQITIPEPTAFDSWAQFFKNVPQMGMVVLVIIFSGMMANEFSRNTLINILTKGLHRSVVIISKFTMAVFIWTISYTICFVVSYSYTVYFWSNDIVSNIFFSVFCLWLFGVLLIATMMLGGVIIKSNYGCLLFTGAFVVILFLVNLIPKLQDYNPIMLSSRNMALLSAELSSADFIKAIAICCSLSIVFLVSAVTLFNKKQL